MIAFEKIRDNFTLWIIGLYLILNYGFMQVRIPPFAGSGVPIGEMVLIGFLLTLNYAKLIPRFHKTLFILPFAIWWLYGLTRASQGLMGYGLWAFRDATHVIESLFILVGFAYAAKPERIEGLFRWLPKILLIGVIYSLGYPFKSLLIPLSPTLISGTGAPIPIFFTYTNTSMLILLYICYLLIFKETSKGLGWRTLLTIVFFQAFVLFMFQARTIYIEWIAAITFLSFHRQKILGRAGFAILLIAIVVLVLPLIGLEIKGRLGQTADAHFFLRHFLAIFGIASEGLEGPVNGFYQRIDWWVNLYENWTRSITSMLFGLGYGIPLTDFKVGAGIAVREPHNSYISILSRIGIVGFSLFIWIHLLLVNSWHKAFRLCKKIRWTEGQSRLLFLMIYFIFIWVSAMGEDAFEKPFYAIPYFFFWGVVLRFLRHLRQGSMPVESSASEKESLDASTPRP